MKILSLDIAAFGKFKNYHLDIPDNMTVIFGENENGKSTVMAFIRMMFYGNTGKTSDIDKNPRIKYRPWDSDLMAGSVTFGHGGKSYRLERNFKRSNSTDKITLIDLDTGESTPLSGSDDIGAKFFGLTDAAFERSVFLSDSVPAASNEAANGEINSRLSNAATTGNDEVSFEKISARLLKAKEVLFSKGGKKGLCDKAVSEKDGLISQIKAAEETEKGLDELKGEIAEKEAELSRNSAESARLFEILKSADKIKKKAITEKYLEAVAEKSRLEDKLRLTDGRIADSGFIAKGRELLAARNAASDNLAETDKKLTELKEEIETLSAAEPVGLEDFDKNRNELCSTRDSLETEIESTRQKLSDLNKELDALIPTKKNNPLFFIMGLAVLVAGGVLFAVAGALIGGAVMAAGLIVAALGFVIKKTVAPDDSALKNELSSLSVELSGLVDKKDAVSEKLGALDKKTQDLQVKALADKAILEEKIKQTNELSRQKDSLAAALEDAENAALCFVSNLTETKDISAVGTVLSSAEEQLKSLEAIAQKAELLADHGSITSLEQAKARLEAIEKEGLPEGISEEELDLAKERFKAQSDQNGRMRSEISALKTRLKALAEATPSVALLRLREEELNRQIESYNGFGSRVDTALEVLDEAFREMRKNYSGALESRTAEIFSYITEQKYSSVNITKSFELGVTTKEVFGLKDSRFLSAGTEDQLYLALRLALAELMTEQTGVLPLLMDDPLSQYDDKRMEQTVKFLTDYAKERQLLLFTCHTTVADAARAENANIITL